MNNQDYILLDLFSGTGGFSLGFKKAGFKFNHHYFSEIEKHAIANYKYNFKKAKYVGSVKDVSGTELRKRHPKSKFIITFGSPCQDFSLAGKRKGMDGERSSLILEAIRLISEIKPSFFIWENVKGTFSSNNGADFWAILNAFTNIGGYRLEWQLLNTKWFLPQNRERIYLVGHLATANRSFKQIFPITKDGKSFNASKTGTKSKTKPASSITTREGGRKEDTFIIVDKKKKKNQTYAATLTGGGNSGGNHSDMDLIQIKSATKKGFEVATKEDSINFSNPNSETRRGRVGKGVAQTLETSCNQGVIVRGGTQKNAGELKNCSTALTEAMGKGGGHIPIIRPVLTPNRKEKRQNGRRFKEDGEPAFTLNCQDQQGVLIQKKETVGNPQGTRVYETDGISSTINSGGGGQGGQTGLYEIGQNQIRRLTEIECERLQGFPDDWTKYGDYDGIIKVIATTNRLILCGNAVTVDVVEEIAKRLKTIE